MYLAIPDLISKCDGKLLRGSRWEWKSLQLQKLKRNFNTVQYNTKNIAIQAIC